MTWGSPWVRQPSPLSLGWGAALLRVARVAVMSHSDVVIPVRELAVHVPGKDALQGPQDLSECFIVLCIIERVHDRVDDLPEGQPLCGVLPFVLELLLESSFLVLPREFSGSSVAPGLG